MKDHWDYDRIKACPEGTVSDLTALHRNNDPFYWGTPRDVDMAEWFGDVWEAGGFGPGTHLRRMHYWLVSQAEIEDYNGKPYRNTRTCWNHLTTASKAARYMGYVDIGDIVDRRNPDPYVVTEYADESVSVEVEVPELEDPNVYLSGFRETKVQPYHLEVWCEKSTMDDVLHPVCERYNANYVTGVGEMSIPAARDLVDRVRQAARPARIFYVSDFDPAGHSMPKAVARKVEWMMRRQSLDVDVRLVPLVLTLDQVRQYDLPREPIKESELRADSFEDAHGKGAVELDALEALHTGVLGEIVSDALSHYFSEEAEQKRRRLQTKLYREVRDRVRSITERYAEHIAALESMREELGTVRVENVDEYDPGQGTPDADDRPWPWLFDSGRGYLEQLEVYKRYDEGELTDAA